MDALGKASHISCQYLLLNCFGGTIPLFSAFQSFKKNFFFQMFEILHSFEKRCCSFIIYTVPILQRDLCTVPVLQRMDILSQCCKGWIYCANLARDPCTVPVLQGMINYPRVAKNGFTIPALSSKEWMYCPSVASDGLYQNCNEWMMNCPSAERIFSVSDSAKHI